MPRATTTDIGGRSGRDSERKEGDEVCQTTKAAGRFGWWEGTRLGRFCTSSAALPATFWSQACASASTWSFSSFPDVDFEILKTLALAPLAPTS